MRSRLLWRMINPTLRSEPFCLNCCANPGKESAQRQPGRRCRIPASLIARRAVPSCSGGWSSNSRTSHRRNDPDHHALVPWIVVLPAYFRTQSGDVVAPNVTISPAPIATSPSAGARLRTSSGAVTVREHPSVLNLGATQCLGLLQPSARESHQQGHHGTGAANDSDRASNTGLETSDAWI